MTDIIVVGGGIIGRACAVSLAEQGARVMLVDASMAMPAASAATTGVLMPPMSRTMTPLHEYAQQSAMMYAAWCIHLANTTGIVPEYVPSGALRLLSHDDRRTGETPPSYLNPRCVRQVIAAPAAHIDTTLLMRALAVRFAHLGGYTVEARVVALDAYQHTIRSVILAHGIRLHADAIVIAAGHVSGTLLAPLGVTLPIMSEHGKIVQLDDVPAIPSAILLDGDYMFVMKGDGRLHATGPGNAEAIQARARMIFGGGTIAKVWHGTRPRIRGGVPYVGQAGHWTNLFVAAGHGKNGFLLAPLTAQHMVSTLLRGHVN